MEFFVGYLAIGLIVGIGLAVVVIRESDNGRVDGIFDGALSAAIAISSAIIWPLVLLGALIGIAIWAITKGR